MKDGEAREQVLGHKLFNLALPGDSPDKSRAWVESTEETTLTAFAGILIAAAEEQMVDFFGGTTTLLSEDKK